MSGIRRTSNLGTLGNVGAVMTFANSAARTSVLASPTEGMVSYLQDVDEFEIYDGSSWLRAVVTADDENITTTGTIKASVFNAGANNVLGTLQIGDSSISNSDGSIVIGKNNGAGGNRHFKIGYDSSFNIGIGDYGFNGTAGTWAAAIKMPYDTPDSTIVTTNAGYVRHPTQPRFLADRNGNLAYTPAGAVVFNRTTYNVGSHYNTTTGLFQAPVAGTYWFQVGILQSVAVSQLWWIINGARERSFVLENYGLGNLSGMGCLYLNASDTVGVASWSNGSACTIYENIHHTYFRGGLLV